MDKPHRLFEALADETRLRLLNLLARRPHCVCEFQSILRVSQPKISRHLAYLRQRGLVAKTRHGKMIMYALAKPQNAVHASVVRCVCGCFPKIGFLQRETERDRKTKPIICD